MLYEIFLALIVVGSLVIVISENRKPYISLFWILFITLLPGVGLLFYLLLGKDYRSRRVIKADELALLDTLRNQAIGNSIETLATASRAIHPPKNIRNLPT